LIELIARLRGVGARPTAPLRPHLCLVLGRELAAVALAIVSTEELREVIGA
jgi:hypothetical protein